MSVRLFDYFYIFAVIALTVFGNIIIKWRVNHAGELPANSQEKFNYIFSLILDPVIITGYLAAFLASIVWIIVMTKFDLSYAYPFASLNFVIILLLSALILNEPLSFYRLLGVSFIMLGVFFASRG